jgi:carbamoylphosphate synthase large subunit
MLWENSEVTPLTTMTEDEYKQSQVSRPSVIRTIKNRLANIQSSVDHLLNAVIEAVGGRVSAGHAAAV